MAYINQVLFWERRNEDEDNRGLKEAHVAQLVERILGKDEVIGSNPIMGSSCLFDFC